MREIVVGFDGSKSAEQALRWAADEASSRGCRLNVLRSPHEPFHSGSSRSDLAASVVDVLGDDPGVPLVTNTVDDAPVDALVKASERAEMVVVGARGLGGFVGLLLGSVSQRVATRAASVVVVVRDTPPPGGDVVAGVDGSPGSRVALKWAADEARRRGVRLRAVMAWNYLLQQGEHGPEPFRSGYTAKDARQALRTIVAEVLGPTPEVEVAEESVCELQAKALVEHSADASLLVVAPRRESAQERSHLGPVTTQVLQHAPTAVAVVRASPEGDS